MPQLLTLKIHQLRNLANVDVQLGPRFNILYGDNGSGKTSFLESIHYLGLGRSFRTRQHNRVIAHDSDHCVIFSQFQHAQMDYSLGVQRTKGGDVSVKLCGEHTQLNAVADLLPIQLIHPDGHKLIASGPKYRRQFLDWGVFHVEQSFYSNWLRAQRAIKQRNSLLKTKNTNYSAVETWDADLCTTASRIHSARSSYVEQLYPILNETLEQMQLDVNITTEYSPGWDTERGLSDCLQQSFERDLKMGHTQYGPHKADLVFKMYNKPAHEVLSQGQQKMLIYALKLSQTELMRQLTNKTSIYLIDDLPAELDAHKRNRLTELLMTHSSQVFLTCIDESVIAPFIETEEAQLFHVKHGTIHPEAIST